MKVVERIYALMESRGVAATELSKSTGINASTLTQWKKGLQKPSTDAIIKIAHYFGVTTDYLLIGRSNHQPTQLKGRAEKMNDKAREALKVFLPLIQKFEEACAAGGGMNYEGFTPIPPIELTEQEKLEYDHKLKVALHYKVEALELFELQTITENEMKNWSVADFKAPPNECQLRWLLTSFKSAPDYTKEEAYALEAAINDYVFHMQNHEELISKVAETAATEALRQDAEISMKKELSNGAG
jgi:transcriptional regulator with XRE-family HTH domain